MNNEQVIDILKIKMGHLVLYNNDTSNKHCVLDFHKLYQHPHNKYKYYRDIYTYEYDNDGKEYTADVLREEPDDYLIMSMFQKILGKGSDTRNEILVVMDDGSVVHVGGSCDNNSDITVENDELEKLHKHIDALEHMIRDMSCEISDIHGSVVH